MIVDDLYKLKKELSEDGVVFCYAGPIWQEMIIEINKVLKRKMELVATATVTKKILIIFIEHIQNIMKYSADEEIEEMSKEKYKSGIMVIGKKEDNFYILGGNLIERKQKATILERLEKIRSMDKDQLKAYFKKQIKEEPHEGSKGAGLGFIDMARRASKPIEYSINDIDNIYSFFSLKVII